MELPKTRLESSGGVEVGYSRSQPNNSVTEQGITQRINTSGQGAIGFEQRDVNYEKRDDIK